VFCMIDMKSSGLFEEEPGRRMNEEIGSGGFMKGDTACESRPLTTDLSANRDHEVI
jgi:hypothetical protein